MTLPQMYSSCTLLGVGMFDYCVKVTRFLMWIMPVGHSWLNNKIDIKFKREG